MKGDIKDGDISILEINILVKILFITMVTILSIIFVRQTICKLLYAIRLLIVVHLFMIILCLEGLKELTVFSET